VRFGAILAFAVCGCVRADFSYHETLRQARAASAATRYFHANRMAVYTKNHATVVDLDKETVTEIDFAKKTYSTHPLAQVKPASPEGPRAASKAMAEAKSFGVLRATESIVTAGDLTVDCWLATVPGYDDAKTFLRKLGEKAGYGSTLPRALEAFADAAKEILSLPGAPVETTWKWESGETFRLDLSDLNAAPVSGSKFDVPAGFKPAPAGR